MGRLLVIGALGALLFAAVWLAIHTWTSLDVAMPAAGWTALVLGVVFSILVGSGLMALMFYSSRRGYDDRATGERERITPQPR